MEEEEDMLPPFWLQSSNDTPRRRRLRRSPSSLLLNSGFLLILLLAIAFYFFFIVIPSIVSFTSQLFKPQLLKKGWESLNLVLVLFAIICGFLSKNSNENATGTSTSTNTSTRSYDHEDQGVSSETTQEVDHNHNSNPYEYSDRTAGYNAINRLRRNSSSYPDLRQESAWITPEERWRFYDDQQLFHHLQPRREPLAEEEEDLDTKNTAVETSVVEEVSIPSYTPPPPPPPAPTPPKRKPKRTHQALAHKEKNDTPEKSDSQVKNFQPPPLRPRPPPPPPPLPMFQDVEEKSSRNEKKRGVTTKDIFSTLRRRKKKQRQKSVENFDNLLNSQAPSSSYSYSLPLYPPPSPPPPPPPLPPPPSVFHNLFSSKKGKNKKNPPPPPPPPPPPMRATKFSSERPIMAHRPPLPSKVSNFNGVDDSVSNCSESPILVPIPSPPPPPPPPPPFKIPEWKYVAHGDHFVRIQSDNSSRSGSPDLDDGEGSPSKETGQSSGEDSTTPTFCSSPDVNSKADTFIERFRAGLRLEKMNSIKEKQGRGKSHLCPETGPS